MSASTPTTKGRALRALPIILAGAVLIPGAALADCTVLDKDLREAIGAADLARFPDLHSRMLADTSCDGQYRARVGRVLALASLKKMQADAGGGGTIALDQLKQAASYGQPWQVMVALGDAQYGAKQYGEAVRAYESALDDMRDTALNPKPPAKEDEERVAKLAYQARALAPVYVATRRFRGKVSGAGSPNFRNFTAESVPVPVRFEYDAAVLTPDGEKAVADILAYLGDHSVAHVKLIGHTDPRGNDGYNLGLSLARAEAVKGYLLANGYKGNIEVVGLGERAPFVPDDPAKYSEEERYAFDRRVEYQLVK
ncbi:MAG: OmpA family protein [Pseudomonadota bacterium]|nr:OmpA family protein [Pseudomonadota bacterium]